MYILKISLKKELKTINILGSIVLDKVHLQEYLKESIYIQASKLLSSVYLSDNFITTLILVKKLIDKFV